MAKGTKKPRILDAALPSGMGMVRFSAPLIHFTHCPEQRSKTYLILTGTALHLKGEFLLIYMFPFPTLLPQERSLIHS